MYEIISASFSQRSNVKAKLDALTTKYSELFQVSYVGRRVSQYPSWSAEKIAQVVDE